MSDAKMIGLKIAEARKKVNISQATVAQRLFISPQAVGKWERGESMPDIATISNLAGILGVDLNYFSDAFSSPAAAPAMPSTATLGTAPGRSWDMSGGNWADADFSGLSNLHDKFSGSNLQRCKFTASGLSGLMLKGNHIDSCDFSRARFDGSQVALSHLVNSHFMHASLKDAGFSGSHIRGCDFSGADFSGAVFKTCSLRQLIITGAVFRNVAFSCTDFQDILFDGILEDCIFEECTFSKVSFQHVRLINCFFKGGNFKKIKFADCEADRLTYEFLKNGKADVSGIAVINL